MRKLALLTLLFCAPAYSLELAQPTLCSSVGKYFATPAACPAEIQLDIGGSVGTDQSGGTVTVAGTNTVGEAHVCLSTATFDADSDGVVDSDRAADCVAGTNIDSKQTSAFVGAGTNEVTLTGLTASTSYYSAVVFVPSSGSYQNRPVRDDDVAPVFNTVASGGSGLETENARFVGPGGSDAANGMTYATRWLTEDKVNSETLPIGTDVYFEDDGDFSGSDLLVDWGGASDDSVIIGTYCNDGGTPIAHDSANGACGDPARLAHVELAAGLSYAYLQDIHPESVERFIKWNPGHYGLMLARSCTEDDLTDIQTEFNNLAPEVRGIVCRVGWATLEQETRGNYAPGIAFVNQILDYAEAAGKVAGIRFEQMEHKPTDALCENTFYPYNAAVKDRVHMPKYLREEGLTWLAGVNPDSTCSTNIWNTTVQTDLNNLNTAYAAAFDGDVRLAVWVLTKESAIGPNPIGEGYTHQNFEDAMVTISTHALSVWKSTPIFLSVNSTKGGASWTTSLAQEAISLGVGVHGPDVAPDCVAGGGAECTNGFHEPQRTGEANTGCCEYVYNELNSSGNGVIPIGYSVESSELKFPASVGSGYYPVAIETFMTDFVYANFLWWHLNNDPDSDDEQKWDAVGGIEDYIEANEDSLRSDCPSVYVGRCSTGLF